MAESFDAILKASYAPQIAELNEAFARIVESQTQQMLAGFQPVWEAIARHAAAEMAPALEGIRQHIADEFRTSNITVASMPTEWEPAIVTASPAPTGGPLLRVDVASIVLVATLSLLTVQVGRAMDAGDIDTAIELWFIAVGILFGYCSLPQR